MKIVGWTAVIVAVILLACFLQGWVLSILWGWFIAPVFGLPYLTTVQGIGISVFVNFLHPTPKADDKQRYGFAQAMLIASIVSLGAPLLFLAFGWIVYVVFM